MAETILASVHVRAHQQARHTNARDLIKYYRMFLQEGCHPDAESAAYAGYNAPSQADRLPGPLTRALCWSHARRYFFELADAAAQLRNRREKAHVITPLAVEAVRP